MGRSGSPTRRSLHDLLEPTTEANRGVVGKEREEGRGRGGRRKSNNGVEGKENRCDHHFGIRITKSELPNLLRRSTEYITVLTSNLELFHERLETGTQTSSGLGIAEPIRADVITASYFTSRPRRSNI